MIFLVVALIILFCSGQQCLVAELGYDQLGNDLAYEYVTDQSDCCNTCLDTPGCVAWSYKDYSSGGGCWMKNATSMPQESPGTWTCAIGPSGSSQTTAQYLHQVTNGQCEVISHGDWKGYDIPNGFYHVNDIAGCCNLCAETTICNGWSYLDGCCWLKDVPFSAQLILSSTITAGRVVDPSGTERLPT